jgi:hypothetical protein
MTSFRRALKKNRNFPICAGCCSIFGDRALQPGALGRQAAYRTVK